MRILRLILATAVIAVGAACGSDSPTQPPDSVVGTYHLYTVNGTTLPVTVFQTTGYRLEVLAGTLVLASNGAYLLTTVFLETENGQVNQDEESETGNYTVSGSTVTLTDSDGFTSTGTATATSLVITESGVTLVFLKQ